MTLQELTNRLQDLCHNGHAQDCVGVSVLDATYAIEGIKSVCIPQKEDELLFMFMIQAKWSSK